tara:strand:+ start:132694 stop:134967 length:2274 start_codon:yes stop_codon:yes gene_type:complete
MRMINLKSVSVSNFKAFGQQPTTLNLDQKGTCLIIGNNLDVGSEGESRNGVSKTSILESVVFALYGKGLNKNRPDDMVNYYNERNMVVELSLNVGGIDYVIRRGRKPNLLTLKSYRDGEEIDHTRDSLKNTDVAIQEVIGVSYDVYLSVFFMNPWRNSFMSMSGVEQRSFMEQLLSLDTLAARAETLKKMKKDITVDLKLAEKDLDHAKRTHDQTVERLEKAKRDSSDWGNANQAALEAVQEEISQYDGVDFDQILKDHEEVEKRISADRQDFNETIKSNQSRRSEIESLIRDIDHSIKSQTSLKTQADSYMDTMNEKLEAAKGRIPEGVEIESIIEMEEILAEAKETRSHLEQRKSGCERTVDSTTRSISRLERSMADVKDEISTLESGVCPYCEQSHFDADKVASLREKLDVMEDQEMADLRSTLEGAEAELAECQGQLEELTAIEAEIDIPISSRELEKMLDAVERIEESMKTNPHLESLKAAVEDAGGDVAELTEARDETQNHLGAAIQEKEEAEAAHKETQAELEGLANEALGGFRSVANVHSAKAAHESAVRKKTDLDGAVNPYEKIIEDITVPDIAEEEKVLDDLRVKETHVGYLIRLLTDSKSFIRKNIVDQYMPFINKKIVEYTRFLDLPHVPLINADMTVEIEYMGKDVSYHSMSRGEQLRLDVATSMAFKELLGVMGVSCNVLMLDEIFDSAVDQSGIKKMFRFVKDAADHVLLISHREEFQSMVDSTLVVTKSNSFATLELVDRV